MTDFLIIMGIGFTTLLLAVVIYLMWILFLWPFVEAVSLTRMTREYWRINGCKRGVWRTIRLFLTWYAETVFGRRFEAVHSCGWRWEAVGKWWVYKDEQD
ncbi:hypothetical protein QA051_gp20 [Salmonella phage celemicas]|uniref:Uncharacterized protein n=1 Tax=Salmonella phage celemicas TaxID=2713289 RepID=A0A6G8RR63_9CAUD|nr:hypothetical protein QA051_gp20 [Salmonella phage celemicas]EEB7324564.1 hypothetical protein [Salmonella enterica subsp. enterica serovar Enteritidis]QIO03812.1 hypothetical protein celemicas_20 [Salmonella phage celemicas]